MCRHAVELQFNILAPIGRIELEGAAIPTDAALAIALLFLRGLVKRLLDGPIMRQVHYAPVLVIESSGCRAPGMSGLGVSVREIRTIECDALAAGKRFQRDVPEMKPPVGIERQLFS